MVVTNKKSHNKQELTTKDKADSIVDMLITQAHDKLKSDKPLTASEMKVCLDICKTYSSGIQVDTNMELLKDLPFDDED